MPKTPPRTIQVKLVLSAQEKGWLDFVAKKKGLSAQNAIRAMLKETSDLMRRKPYPKPSDLGLA